MEISGKPAHEKIGKAEPDSNQIWDCLAIWRHEDRAGETASRRENSGDGSEQIDRIGLLETSPIP